MTFQISADCMPIMDCRSQDRRKTAIDSPPVGVDGGYIQILVQLHDHAHPPYRKAIDVWLRAAIAKLRVCKFRWQTLVAGGSSRRSAAAELVASLASIGCISLHSTFANHPKPLFSEGPSAAQRLYRAWRSQSAATKIFVRANSSCNTACWAFKVPVTLPA